MLSQSKAAHHVDDQLHLGAPPDLAEEEGLLAHDVQQRRRPLKQLLVPCSGMSSLVGRYQRC